MDLYYWDARLHYEKLHRHYSELADYYFGLCSRKYESHRSRAAMIKQSIDILFPERRKVARE